MAEFAGYGVYLAFVGVEELGEVAGGALGKEFDEDVDDGWVDGWLARWEVFANGDGTGAFVPAADASVFAMFFAVSFTLFGDEFSLDFARACIAQGIFFLIFSGHFGPGVCAKARTPPTPLAGGWGCLHMSDTHLLVVQSQVLLAFPSPGTLPDGFRL